MGYSIFMTNVRFFIAEDNKYNAYRAFKASPLASAIRVPIHSIEDTLDYFGYTAENDLEDNIIGLEHTKDKLHDEDELFFVIAPYVRSGSFIEMLGEDHYMWRWVFNDGTLEKITLLYKESYESGLFLYGHSCSGKIPLEWETVRYG